MHEERKKILTMLKNGEISIDEANALLEELEKVQTEKTRKEDYLMYEVSPVFEQESTREKRGGKSFLATATDKLSSLIGTAAKKIKEMDLDFYHSVSFDHVLQTNETDFSKIDINIPFGSTTIHVWDADEVRAECKVKVYRTETLEEGKKKFSKDVSLKKEEDTLSFISREKFMKVDVQFYFPRKYYERISVQLLNGDIEVETFRAEKWKCKTINGKVRLAECHGDEGELETGNGVIILTHNQFTDLEAETLNGKINVDGSFHKLDLKSITGTINATVTNQDVDTIRLESGTSPLYVTIPPDIPVYGEVQSFLGSFYVELDDVHISDVVKETVQKIAKFERGITGEQQPLFIYAESKTGSIFIKQS